MPLSPDLFEPENSAQKIIILPLDAEKPLFRKPI